MPTVSSAMLERLGLTTDGISKLADFDVSKEIHAVAAGSSFTVGDTLFERITPERIEELKQKYGSVK